jgi:hypothetical protein
MTHHRSPTALEFKILARPIRKRTTTPPSTALRRIFIASGRTTRRVEYGEKKQRPDDALVGRVHQAPRVRLAGAPFSIY